MLVWSEADCFLPTKCARGISCKECLESNIKWVITENNDYMENYAEKLVNAVAKTILEAFESLTITDVDMYRLGYEKAINDFVETVKKIFPDDRNAITNLEIIAERLKAGGNDGE